jgi:hypothetical protein
MIAIEADLRKSPLWTVYERDVVQLEPILEFMSAAGMPVDAGVRREKAIELAKRQSAVLSRMIEVVPQEARRIQHVYKKTPKDTTGLVMVEALQTVKRCSVCGEVSPKKAHFTDRSHGRGVHKSILPGCTGSVVQSDELTVCYAKQADFKPSREQLIRYNEALNRPVPTKYDKISRGRKASMDVKAIKKLMGTYEDDLLYPLVLEYRTIDKLLGTYLGRPVDNES